MSEIRSQKSALADRRATAPFLLKQTIHRLRRLHRLEVREQRSEVMKKKISQRSQRSDVRGQKSALADRRATAPFLLKQTIHRLRRLHRLEVREQRSEVRSQNCESRIANF